MVVLGGGAVSYERGTPVDAAGTVCLVPALDTDAADSALCVVCEFACASWQGSRVGTSVLPIQPHV